MVALRSHEIWSDCISVTWDTVWWHSGHMDPKYGYMGPEWWHYKFFRPIVIALRLHGNQSDGFTVTWDLY